MLLKHTQRRLKLFFHPVITLALLFTLFGLLWAGGVITLSMVYSMTLLTLLYIEFCTGLRHIGKLAFKTNK
jgi:hypothetical protein